MKKYGLSAWLPGTTLIAPAGQRIVAGMVTQVTIISDFQKKTAANPIPLRSTYSAARQRAIAIIRLLLFIDFSPNLTSSSHHNPKPLPEPASTALPGGHCITQAERGQSGTGQGDVIFRHLPHTIRIVRCPCLAVPGSNLTERSSTHSSGPPMVLFSITPERGSVLTLRP